MIFFPLQAVHVLQVLQAVGRRSLAGGGAFCGPYMPRAVVAVLPVARHAVRLSPCVLWPLWACCVSVVGGRRFCVGPWRGRGAWLVLLSSLPGRVGGRCW